MRIDLHTHTTASDGLLDAPALVGAAAARGVGLLAVSDHDSTASVDEAIAAGRRAGVEVWPAVELSCDVEAGEVHMLGYLLDHHLDWFEALLVRLRDGRVARAERMVEKLAAIGVPIDYARVETLAAGGAIGRPHVARVLVEAGWVKEPAEAFDRFIGRGGPAYVERVKVTPAEAVAIIRAAGGLAVFAHPGWARRDEWVAELVPAGLDGIEVYYPDHGHEMIMHYLALARQYGLLVTGGTDFHGGALATRVPVGSQYVPEEIVPPMRERAATRRPARVAPQMALSVE
jgi:predicted metal-dependent phosphoesterase TrpH